MRVFLVEDDPIIIEGLKIALTQEGYEVEASVNMTEALEKSVDARGIPVLDGLTAFAVLKDGDRACGILCCDRLGAFHVLAARAVVLATGGPADLYENSVYPESQTGMTGMALRAGAGAGGLGKRGKGAGARGRASRPRSRGRT